MVRLKEFWRFRWVRQCVLRCIFGTFSSVIFELQPLVVIRRSNTITFAELSLRHHQRPAAALG